MDNWPWVSIKLVKYPGSHNEQYTLLKAKQSHLSQEGLNWITRSCLRVAINNKMRTTDLIKIVFQKHQALWDFKSTHNCI